MTQPPGAARGHDDEEPLAEAMRRGMMRRPDQAFGEYYHGHNASCALGATYEGLYRLPEEAEGIVPKDLWRFYECLDFVIRRCPAGCRKRVPLGALIVHLNDDHRWTREQIADWLTPVPAACPFHFSRDYAVCAVWWHRRRAPARAGQRRADRRTR